MMNIKERRMLKRKERVDKRRLKQAWKLLVFEYGDKLLSLKPGDTVFHVVGLPGYEKRFPHTVESVDHWKNRVTLVESDLKFSLDGSSNNFPCSDFIVKKEEK